MENWLWWPSLFFLKLLKIQYQPSLCHTYIRIKSLLMIYSWLVLSLIWRRQNSESAVNWLWRPSCSSEIVENQYQPSLCHLIAMYNIWWWYIHNFSFNWSDVIKILSQQKIGCGGHFVFQKLLKLNTSQAYATLYPHTKFGDDIFITFPLTHRTSSKLWVSRKLAVAAILLFRNCWKSIPAKPSLCHLKAI